MLSDTLGNMVDRHNASVANRQAHDNAARAALADRARAIRKASEDFLGAYNKHIRKFSATLRPPQRVIWSRCVRRACSIWRAEASQKTRKKA